MSIDSQFAEGLDELARKMQGRVFSPGEYTVANFHRLPGRRYLNTATGSEVSRRERDRLVGRPLPSRRVTLRQARAAVAAALESGGVTVAGFRGTIGTGKRTRERTMREPTQVSGEALAEVAERYSATGSAAGFGQAFLEAWWNGVADYDSEDIDDVDEFEWELDAEPELDEDAA